MTLSCWAHRHDILSAGGVRGKDNVQLTNMGLRAHTFVIQLLMLVSLGVQGYDKYAGTKKKNLFTEIKS